jgi:hypothetical protein
LINRQQRRFSERKWFSIQSNTRARKMNQLLGIVNSLIILAPVKMSIKDHLLASKDIRKAEQLYLTSKYIYKLLQIKNNLIELNI